MIDRISSSVTFPESDLRPNRLKTKAVLFASNQTKGEATNANRYIGRATTLAALSATLIPIRLGTSSPKIKVK